jgi:MFS family permease
VKGTLATVAIASICIPLTANQQQERGLVLVLPILLLALLPALGLWAELTRIFRAREVLAGLVAAIFILALAVLLANVVSGASPFMDQQQLRGRLVAGLVTGLGAGAAYASPGALLARQVPDELRRYLHGHYGLSCVSCRHSDGRLAWFLRS